MRKMFLSHLPHEVLAGVAWSLTVKDVGRLSGVCQVLSQEASDPELWMHLFMRSCWPPTGALVNFAEGGGSNPAALDWRARLRGRVEAAPTIVVDIGRGYTKYTVVHGLRGRLEDGGQEPGVVQLCSSNTHPANCSQGSQFEYISLQIDRALALAALVRSPEGEVHELHGKIVKVDKAEGSGNWSVRLGHQLHTVSEAHLLPLRRSGDLAMVIGEPFTVSAAGRNREGWDVSLQSQLGRCRDGRAPVQVVSQAQMALWAHGIDHGIVVNIGFGEVVALAVVNGEVAQEATVGSDLASRDLTMAMMRYLGNRYNFVDSRLMTWCRDLKETYCYVVPPAPHTRKALVDRLAEGDHFGIRPVDVEVPPESGVNGTITLDRERVLVPEELFINAAGRPSLPMLIARCADLALSSGRCDEDGVRRLLRQVVLVGGAAEFPGLRPRTEYEVRFLLKEDRRFERLRTALVSPDDVFVLNPPLGDGGTLATPRFVPLLGGCVRAVSSKDSRVGSTGRRSVIPEPAAMGGGQLSAVQRMRAFWLRQRLFNLDGSTVFRTGGGGGDDDQVMTWFQHFEDDDVDEDEDEDGGQGEAWGPQDATQSDSSDKDSEAGEASPAAEALPVAEASGADWAAATNAWAASTAEPPPPPPAPPGDGSPSSASSPVGRSRRRGRGRGASSSAAAAASAPQSGKSQGKGKGQGPAAGRGRGKGKGKLGRTSLVWRPVQRG